MLYDNCWAIRLIVALLLTIMSRIRPVPSPQGGFGGLRPQNSNLKTINSLSVVSFYNVKASTGKQKLTLTITLGKEVPRNFSKAGNVDISLILFQVAIDAMQMEFQ